MKLFVRNFLTDTAKAFGIVSALGFLYVAYLHAPYADLHELLVLGVALGAMAGPPLGLLSATIRWAWSE